MDYHHDYIRWDAIDDIPDMIPIRSSVGCPYKCAYCDFYTIFTQLKLRSRDGLLAELKIIENSKGKRRPLTFLQFRDDNALATESRLHEICDISRSSKLKISWSSFLRTSYLNEHNVELLRKSGLKAAYVGVESGDPGQLERMNRIQDLEPVRKAIELLDSANITVGMFFIVGFPGENDATLRNTASFIDSISLKRASSVYQIYPLVLPPLSKRCLKKT